MVGKTVLVGKTFTHGEQELNRVQFHGPIEMVDEKAGFAIRRTDNDEIEWLPPDLRAFFPAEKGVYTLSTPPAGTGRDPRRTEPFLPCRRKSGRPQSRRLRCSRRPGSVDYGR